jgi:hypothetical protein
MRTDNITAISPNIKSAALFQAKIIAHIDEPQHIPPGKNRPVQGLSCSIICPVPFKKGVMFSKKPDFV